MGHPLDTHVILYMDDELRKAVSLAGADLRAVSIVSRLDTAALGDAPVDAVLGELPGLAVEVRKAGGDKCERCWMYSEELGTDPAYPTVCPRCAAVLRELAAREEGAR